MNLLSPATLLWLLPALGAILALYLLKMRRDRVRVPASFLWPARTEEIRANAPIQRLRFSWLMILQMLAMAIAIVAIARPQVRQAGLVGENTILVLDTSASMRATDVKPSRFERGREIALGALRSARAGDRVALIEAGATPRVVFPLTNDPGGMAPRMAEIRPTDAEGDMGEALRLAAALAADLRSARIVVISDGVFRPVSDFSPGATAVAFQRVGEQGENLAVNALGAAKDAEGLKVYTGVRNLGVLSRTAKITLYADGRPFASRPLTIAGSKTWGETLPAPPGARLLEARLEANDELAADNVAYALNDPGATARVLLIGSGDPFLERALALDPRVTLDRTRALPSGRGRGYDIVVFEGVDPEPVESRGVLVLGSANSRKGVRIEKVEGSPLVEGVDLSAISITRGGPVSGGEPVTTGSVGALLSTSTGAQRRVELGFAPLDSDFPLLPGFPIFVANALDFLLGGETSRSFVVAPGRPFTFPATGSVQIEGPNGKTTVESISGLASVRSIDRTGVYRLTAGGETRTVLAGLRSEIESNTRPAERLSLGGGQVAASKAPTRLGDFWRPLVLLVLAVLAVEWWVFVRKS